MKILFIILALLTMMVACGFTELEIRAIDPKIHDICYQMGPFETEKSIKNISKKLQTLGTTTYYRKELAQLPSSFSVYLPKYKTSDVAKMKYKELEENGFEHLIVRVNGSLVKAISLGEFSTEKAAKKWIMELQVDALDPKIHTEYTESERYWIDIKVNSTQSHIISTLESIKKGLTVLQLKTIDCNKDKKIVL